LPRLSYIAGKKRKRKTESGLSAGLQLACSLFAATIANTPLAMQNAKSFREHLMTCQVSGCSCRIYLFFFPFPCAIFVFAFISSSLLSVLTSQGVVVQLIGGHTGDDDGRLSAGFTLCHAIVEARSEIALNCILTRKNASRAHSHRRPYGLSVCSGTLARIARSVQPSGH
jgi:hypothetical protein